MPMVKFAERKDPRDACPPGDLCFMSPLRFQALDLLLQLVYLLGLLIYLLGLPVYYQRFLLALLL